MNRYRLVIFKIFYITSIIRFKAQLKPDILAAGQKAQGFFGS